MSDDDFGNRFESFDATVEGFRPLSEMLSGVARSLAAENGWTETQARELVIAMFVRGVRNQR